MRRYAVFPASLTLLLALFVAPFQHVHLAANNDHDEVAEDHHHASSVVHAHDDLISLPDIQTDTPHAESSHRGHHGTSLDTFATEVISAAVLVVGPAQSVLLFIPDVQFAPVEIVEERGHDPPQFEFSTPRAPPV